MRMMILQNNIKIGNKYLTKIRMRILKLEYLMTLNHINNNNKVQAFKIIFKNKIIIKINNKLLITIKPHNNKTTNKLLHTIIIIINID